MEVIKRMAESRYHGWRNWMMRWRNVLKLDTTHNKDVLDYGCGVGLEALQYAKADNRVYLADIAPSNIALAERVLALSGYRVEGKWILEEQVQQCSWRLDVIHCVGVLHHIPEPEPIVEAMASWLREEGELRLMVYSDQAWRIATGTEPPERVEDSPDFNLYWRTWDPIGGYADWYDQTRLDKRFGKWFRIEECTPLTAKGEYLGAVLVKR